MLKTWIIAGFLFASVGLSACSSYRPLYGKGPDGISVTQGLANISVPEQHNRAGQLLRNELLDGIGASPSPRFSLKLDITEKTLDVSSLSSSSAARKRYNISVHYDLLDSVTGKSATSGDSFSNVSYDTINQPVSDLSAADSARLRAAKELGQDLKLRLAAFLSTQKG
jgi:LPS-assembly lipoprotein